MRHLIVAAALSLSCSAIAETWTVDDDGPADFDNIQAAVDAASDGDEILVEPGTYTRTTGWVVDMLGKAVTLRASGTPEETIIDGEGARGVILCIGETAATIIEGFTITRGYAESGGGISCYYGSPTITGCTILNNTATGHGGGGIKCDYYSSPTITGCTISGNTVVSFSSAGGGILSVADCNPTISDCTISGNTAKWGGGIASSGSITISDCTISENTATNYYGGGIYIGGGTATITGCTISGNTTNYYYGGGISCWGNSTITYCTIENNTAYSGGGGIHGSPTITYCTIKNNTAYSGGGIIGSPTLTDTTVCGNAPDQIDGDWTDNGGNTVSDECPPDCPDVDGDGMVGVNDLLAVVAAWGSDDPDADVDGDGTVGTNDLLAVIGAWGPCP